MDTYLSARCLGHMGSYRYVPSWLAVKTHASRGPQRVILIRIEEPPGMQRPGSLSWVTGKGEQVVKSHPPALNRRLVE
jgi:hypothetical protein